MNGGWSGERAQTETGALCGKGNAEEKLGGHGGDSKIQPRVRGRGKLGIFQEETCKLSQEETGGISGQREGETGECEGLLVADRGKKAWVRSSMKLHPDCQGG